MRISELSVKTQVSVHRLRRYESAGLIESRRQSNGYRDYEDKTVRHVIFIAMARDMGFALPRIADYLPCFKAGTLSSKEMVQAIHQRVAEIDAVMAEQQRLRQMLMDHIAWFHTQQRKSQ